MPTEMSEIFKPTDVVPLVLLLCSDKLPNSTGKLYEVGGGRVSQTRWIRAGGHSFSNKGVLAPEQVLQKWDLVTRFDERADHPTSVEEGGQKIFATTQVSLGWNCERVSALC